MKGVSYVKRLCNFCDKVFEIKPSHASYGWGVYCSKTCMGFGMRKGKEVTCTICGTKVYRSPRMVGRSKSGKYFCTKRCQTLWRNQLYVGAKHANYTNGKHSYRTVLSRVGAKKECANCGTKDFRVLAVHHIDRVRTNNDPSNLVWLCHNCHFLVHHYDVGRDRGLLKS